MSEASNTPLQAGHRSSKASSPRQADDTQDERRNEERGNGHHPYGLPSVSSFGLLTDFLITQLPAAVASAVMAVVAIVHRFDFSECEDARCTESPQICRSSIPSGAPTITGKPAKRLPQFRVDFGVFLRNVSIPRKITGFSGDSLSTGRFPPTSVLKRSYGFC
jgi:hypothetical protein